MKSAAERTAAKRQRARDAGRCIVCCTRAAGGPSRSVCFDCTAQTNLRRARWRARRRERTESQRIVAAHERAGDQAYGRHLYQDAAYWYEHAMNLREALLEDRLRVTEKLIRTYFLGNNPGKAVPLTEWLTANYLRLPQGDIKAVEALNALSDQLTIVAFDFDAVFPIAVRAMEIAKSTGIPHVIATANLHYLMYLNSVQQYEAAARFLEEIPPIDGYDDVMVQARYYAQKGRTAASFGEMDACYENFEYALELIEESSDIFNVTGVWVTYAFSALNLGDVGRAKSAVESAIFIAQEHQVTWRLSYLCSLYAEILVIIGQDAAAKEFMAQAFAYEAGRMVNYQLVEAGIPLALRSKDAPLLALCEKLISGEPLTLLPNAGAAVALLYASRGEYARVEEILHDVVLPKTRRFDFNWEALLTVARYGKSPDISVARKVFERRLRFPNAALSQAFLYLFDAYVAERRKKKKATIMYATVAARQFEELGWYGYARRANMLRGIAVPVPIEFAALSENGAGSCTALTLRERQIAGLVLRGCTNRMIATELEITENTVETHMKSIMNRLGIRSRHQLYGALPNYETRNVGQAAMSA